MTETSTGQPETRTRTDRPTVDQSLREYGRGVGGGLLFSLPLIFTMEIWWFGFIIEPRRMVVYILVTFVLLLGYNRFAGLRPDTSWTEIVIDSVEEMGLGLVIAGVLLALLGRITFEMPTTEIIGKTVMEAMTVAIGVSVGTAQLGGSEKQRTGKAGARDGAVHHASQFVVLAFIGAILVASNIAPTEEIVMLGIEMSPPNLIGLVLLSILLSGLILFFSDFIGTQTTAGAPTPLVMVRRTLISYAVALVAAAIILWFFGRFEGASLITIVSQTIVLGIAATLGASAGRLLIQ